MKKNMLFWASILAAASFIILLFCYNIEKIDLSLSPYACSRLLDQCHALWAAHLGSSLVTATSSNHACHNRANYTGMTYSKYTVVINFVLLD